MTGPARANGPAPDNDQNIEGVHPAFDPGLARERTELAWTRTSVSFAALGAAVLKTNPFPGLLIMAMAAMVWGLGRLSPPRRTHGGDDRRRPLLLITIAVTAVSLVALVSLVVAGSAAPPSPY